MLSLSKQNKKDSALLRYDSTLLGNQFPVFFWNAGHPGTLWCIFISQADTVLNNIAMKTSNSQPKPSL